MLGLIAGLPFAFVDWNQALMSMPSVLIPYIIGKVLFGLCFLGVVGIVFFQKNARGHSYFFLSSVLVLNLIPLALRAGVYMGSGALLFEILMLVLPSIAYVVFNGMVCFTNKKQLEADKKYEGKTIDVVDER